MSSSPGVILSAGLQIYMPPGGSSSTPGNVVDGDVLPRRRRCRTLFKRFTEKTNPANLQFKRQIAAVEARQEQRRQEQMSAFLGSCYRQYLPYWNIFSPDVEDGESPIPWNDVFKFAGPSAPLLVKAGTQQGKERLLEDSAKSPDDTDFLEGTFIKINSDKQKATRNKNSKKKSKGKGRKHSHDASEIKSEPSPTKPSSTCADVAGGEDLVLSSSSHVAVGVQLLEYSASSEKELSSSSNDDFSSFDSTTACSIIAASSSVMNDYYTGGNAWNNTMSDDYAGSLSDARSERSLSASGCIDSRGFNKMRGEGSKTNDLRQSVSTIAIGPGGRQEGSSLCRDYASNDDGDFQKVISRKAAQKMKKMQRSERPTIAASGPLITRAPLVQRAPRREVTTLGQYIKDDCSRKPNNKIKGKNHKGASLSNNMSKTTGYTDDAKNVPGGGDSSDTNDSSDYSLAPFSHKTSSSLDHIANSSCVDREEQKKAMAPVGGDGDAQDTDSIAPPSPDTTSSLCHDLSNSSCVVERAEQKKEENEQSFSTHASSELDKIIKASNDAYKIQAAPDAYMIYGAHADIETFLHSTTPVIAQTSCTANDISLQDQCLWSVWRWYEEPECCGIEVEMQGSIDNSSWENPSAYFAPSLSAVQLFGQSAGAPEEPCILSPNHGSGLFFEYFESEMPFLRPPLFTKIKQLLDGVNLSGNPIFGDPKQLKNVKLSDLHPASWFCVSWYPICQIPSGSRSCQAAFLTYHSLGRLVAQTCPTYMADGLQRIICPVAGLLGYRDEEEKWYQLVQQPWSKPTPNGSWKTHHAELLSKKMKALRHCASIMSKAVVPKASGESMNYHPDYEFFWSRSHQ